MLLWLHLGVQTVIDTAICEWTLDGRTIWSARIHLIHVTVAVGVYRSGLTLIGIIILRVEAILVVLLMSSIVIQIQIQKLIIVDSRVSEAKAVRHILLRA